MKFVHTAFENQIIFSENIVNVIVIENPQLFYSIVFDLNEQIKTGKGNFTVSEDIRIIDISKTWSLIINPLDLEMYQKKIITKLYAQIKEQSEAEDLLVETNTIKSALYAYFEKIFDLYTIPLTYTNDINIAELCKVLCIKPLEDAINFLEKITNFIEYANHFLNINTFIFVNLKSYLLENEIINLYSFTQYKKINLLLIENINRPIILSEKKVIIDNDLCEI